MDVLPLESVRKGPTSALRADSSIFSRGVGSADIMTKI